MLTNSDNMKTPIALMLTDTHLSDKNIDLVENIWQQAIDKCKEIDLYNIYFLGDFFDSRKGQPLSVLKAAQRIIKNLSNNNIIVVAICGNHDKANYESTDSFIDVFDSNYFQVINESEVVCKNDLSIHFLPFFKEDSGILRENLNRAIKEAQGNTRVNILLTHIAINGSITNDNEHITNCIPSSEFKDFDRVFVGHFHNRHEFENITYIGSAYQANYGEDDQKGFSILYSDGSYEFIQSEFPKYIKKTVSIDELNDYLLDSDILDEIEHNFVRIEVTGESEKLKSFDRSMLTDVGIDTVLKPNEAIVSLSESSNITHDRKSLNEGFKEFCEENKVNDIEYGLEKMKLL